MTTTTLSRVATSDDSQLYFTSVTGIADADGIVRDKWAYIDREFMPIRAVNSTTHMVTVSRGSAGINAGHASGTTVYWGFGGSFGTSDKSGTTTETGTFINVQNGRVFTVSSGEWSFTEQGATDAQVVISTTHSGADSYQPIAADLELAAGAGDNSDTAFMAPIMGNLLGDTLTKSKNYLGGVIGHYSVTGSGSSTYPTGAVLAGIGDGSTDADGAVVAYIDGDSAQTNAGAAFKVMNNNSTPGSGFAYGLDLYSATRDGYPAVGFTTADIRFSDGTVEGIKTVILTDAQIKALPSTAVEIVPGVAGKIVRVISGIAVSDATAGGYTNITNSTDATAASLSLTYSADDNLLASNPTRSTVLASFRKGWLINPYVLPTVFDPLSYIGDPSPGNIAGSILGEGIFLQAYNSGNFTGGHPDNTLTIKVHYMVLGVD